MLDLPLTFLQRPAARNAVDAGLKVHSALGPGLLESAYEHCLAFEMERRGLAVRRQVSLPISYEGVKLDAGYRIDLLLEECVIVEIKAVDTVTPAVISSCPTS